MKHGLAVCALLAVLGFLQSAALAVEPAVRDIGSQRELFVDGEMIERLSNVELTLHQPRPAGPAIVFDAPWEGPTCAYVTVIEDEGVFRMYYRASGPESESGPEVTCYAESKDGVTWSRPNLGLYEWKGSKENNIVWHEGYGSHSFTPFKDVRPGIPADQRYKALGNFGGGVRGLAAFASADGIHWRKLVEEPVLTKGAFDSQNLAFWDTNRESYVSYFRIFTDGVRAIAFATSDDFIKWSDTIPIELGDTKPEHFYTNATTQYFRAPQYYFAFPKRFVPDRKRLQEHKDAGISDAVFLSSRDGVHFYRTFGEALVRPGLAKYNWGERSTMTANGVVQTSPTEMSIYYSRGYRFKEHHLERGVFRLDGIASARAGAKEGELVTKTLQFDGKQLELNYSTSAAGSVRVELQDAGGQPIPGFALADGQELYGDEISEIYRWKDGSDIAKLAGKPIRLRFVLTDCDLFSYRFGE